MDEGTVRSPDLRVQKGLEHRRDLQDIELSCAIARGRGLFMRGSSLFFCLISHVSGFVYLHALVELDYLFPGEEAGYILGE